MDESVQKHLEQQQGTLKLSAAIRVGVKLRPLKCRAAYFSDSDASCALGAAWQALYGNVNPPAIDEPGAAQLWGISRKMMKSIASKNDRGWSRERIADWLESEGL